MLFYFSKKIKIFSFFFVDFKIQKHLMSAEDIIQIDSDEGENDGQTISVSVIKEKPIDLQKILGNAKKMVADGFNGSNIPTNHIGQYKNEMQNPELALPLPHRMNGLVKKRPHPQTIVANIHEQEKISEEAKKRKIEQILATYSIPVAGEVGPSTSNSNRNHQQNIRKNKTPNNSVNEVLKFCDNYLVSSERRGAHFNVTEEDFLGQFECSYQNCGKCLKDNISLMWHIWAHIVQQKPTEPLEDITNAQISEEIEEVDEEEERTDFSRLLTCPECLLTQPNPHRIQLHYHRVHKRDGFLASNSLLNCNICECVIAKKDIVDHIKEHRIVYQNGRGGEKTTLEMPYSCRFNAKKCQFRTSNRIALIEHFCSAHKGTFVVLCPFCLFTFSIPSAERKRSRVRMSDFMAHISKHDNEKTLFCNQCVTRFAKSDFQLHRTHFNLHHRPPNPTDDRKFQLPTTKALNDIKKGKSIAIGHEFVSRLCLECKMVMKDPPRDHHSQETLICPNEHCEFITNCKRAFAFHQLLGQCNPQNNPRWLFGRPKSIITTNSTNSTLAINSNSDQSQPTLKCSNCQFSTKNVQKMAEHSLQMCPKGKIRLAKFGPEELAELRIFEPNTEEEEEIIKNEKNGNADHCKKKAERPEEQQREWLAEFLPPSRVQGMAQNIKAMKYLKEESVENDEEEKEMDTVMNTLQTLRLALTSNLPSMNNKTNSTTTNVDTGKKRKRVI